MGRTAIGSNANFVSAPRPQDGARKPRWQARALRIAARAPGVVADWNLGARLLLKHSGGEGEIPVTAAQR